MPTALSGLPAIFTFSPLNQQEWVSNTMGSFFTERELRSRIWVDAERQSRKVIDELREETDLWCRCYGEMFKRVKEKPERIGSFFSDLEAAIEGFRKLEDVNKENIPKYELLGEMASNVETRKAIDRLIESLGEFVSVCQDLRWYIGIYEGLLEPRAEEPCETAEEFIKNMRCSVAAGPAR